MPFSLMNAPAVFQRVMGHILKEVDSKSQFVSVYLDDVLIFSKTIAEHLRHLRLVLSRLREVGLKLNPKSITLCAIKLHIWDIIIPSGLKPNADHLVAVKNFPVPKMSRALNSS